MTGSLTASLRRAPAAVPALAAVGLFAVWDADQAGYPLTHWAPGGLLLLALLLIALTAIARELRYTSPATRLAIACLAAYTLLGYLSILWAAVPGDAWEGASRTLLYLLVFALFAGWRKTGASAALLLCAWLAAMIGLAAFAVIHLASADTSALARLAPGGRLIYPAGYANADAAQWLIACWPALLLARGDRLAWPVRGVLGGGAALLAQVALLSQSRGSLYATPVMLVVVFALLPGRTRTFALMLPVAAGVAAAAPSLLRVGDRLDAGQVTTANVHSAVIAIVATCSAVTLLVAAGAALQTRRRYSDTARRRVRRGLAAAALLALLAVLAVGLAWAGDPIDRIEHGWSSFKGGYGTTAAGSRLVSGLGSNRYDFYRVALDEFAAHPLAGIGVDNFQQQYLRHGRSLETPRYPHSVELRTLAQTGVVGALLAIVGLAAALLAARPALRARDPLARCAAGAALAGFAYWLVHGSFDWFWEFAGLGAPAFALLGLACALGSGAASREPLREAAPGARRPADSTRPRSPAGHRRARSSQTSRGPRRRRHAAVVIAGAAAAAAAAYSFAAPWLSELEVQSAARVWTTAPRAAYDRLERAASLNPLSEEPLLVAGAIALRYGDLGRADGYFARALRRSREDPYAIFERGLIASAAGQRGLATARLARAAALDPRNALGTQALSAVRAGRTLDVSAVNGAILRGAAGLP